MWRNGLLILLVGSLLAAGCSGPENDSQITVNYDAGDPVEIEPGLEVAEKLGAVRGKVVNDQGLPIKGARTSLLTTDFFADTNETGGFLFVNVSTGAWTLRVQANGFQPHEQKITVEAAKVTDRVIQLLPDQTAGAGYVPHIHDYWGEKDTYLLMDQAIDFAANDQGGPWPDAYYTVTTGVMRPNLWWPTDAWPIPILETPDGGPPIVIPGTAKMDVTFRWDEATMVMDDLGLCYYSPAEDAERQCFDPAPSGTTFSIDVTPDMADSGHQRFSMWQLTAWRTDVRDASDHSPAATLGSVDVEILLTKGDIYLEPPHEVFWADTDTLVLRSTNDTYTRNTCAVACNPRPVLGLDDGKIVPPGTDRMRVTLAWEFGGVPADAINPDYALTFRTGDMNPQTTFYPQFMTMEATDGSRADQFKVYEFEVPTEWTDAFYQQRSNWQFGIYNADFEPNDEEFRPRDVTYTLEVLAFNDDGV